MKRTAGFASVFLAILSAATSLSAASWTGAGSGSNLDRWDRQQNWSPNTSVPTDSAIFSTTTGSHSPTVPGASTIGGITFNAGADAYIISGAGTLTVGAGGIVNNATANQSFTVSTLALGASQTWNNNGALSVSGGILDLGANTLTVDGSGTTTIGDAIQGTGSLTKSGAGTLSISGINSYSGVTTVSGGTLNAGSASAFGNSTALNISGSTVNLNVDITKPAMAVGLGSSAVLNQGTSQSSFGALTVSGDSQIDLGASGQITFDSAVYNSGLLTITGWDGPAYDANTLNPGGATTGIFITQDPTASGLLANVQFTGPNTYPQGAAWIAGTGELVPVPEPSTYAIVFGLGLIGFAIARRRMAVTA